MLSKVFKTDIEQDFAIAYLKLLGKMYYKQITVTRLVEAAGYGRATFYGYYSGLKELREMLFEYDIFQVNEICTKALSVKSVNERRKLLLDFADRHIKIFWPLISENNNIEHTLNMKKCVMGIMSKDFSKRYSGSEFDAEMIADFCVTGVMQMVVSHYSGSGSMKTPKSDERFTEFVDYVLFLLDRNGLNIQKDI